MKKFIIPICAICLAIAFGALYLANFLAHSGFGFWKWFVIILLYFMAVLYACLSWRFRPWNIKNKD
ncbi:MAG: hypothetical protein J6J35_02415 [Alphaproteobacteria bacterium]|nr:hypothetical protein [Alphaproteobacteria bacterium]